MTQHFHHLILTLAALAVGVPFAAAEPVTLDGKIRPVLKEFCFDCHNPEKTKGDLNLVPIAANAKLDENREVWEKVAELMESREMPPPKKAQPTDEQRDLVLHFLDGQLSKLDCAKERNPGKVTIRRLNKAEYHNTIRDLLNVEFETDDFPNDEVGYGFDNIGDVLSLSPLLMEKFMTAADAIVQKAIMVDAAPKPFTKRLKGDNFQSPNDWVRPLENHVLGLYREGDATASFDAPAKGEYAFKVRGFGELAGLEPPKLALRVGGKELAIFEVKNKKGETYEARATLEAGVQKITVAYLNNYHDETNADPKLRGDRNVFVESVEITGPPGAPPNLPEGHKRLITRMPNPGEEHEVALEVMNRFAKRAYRRPVSDAELERLASFVDLAMKNGGSFLEGVQAGVQAALCSPHFLFRWELDAQALKPGEVRDLGDYEVASRLSYFLWSSMPDPELFALAEKGELRKNGNLEKQVTRMMQDWRSNAFVSNFAGQWLQIRNIWDVGVDPDAFPKWDDSLKGAMKEETELFFQAIMKEDRPVTDLLDADFTFLNEKLARFYGIDGVKGDKMQRVTLPKDSPRGGVLTQGSVLLSTSTPTRTSPVIRGKWILEQILGTPPPPPPPDVPPLKEQRAVDQTTSVRQRLEVHRSAAECSGCHAKMDPLGFALENFDATGAWREQDGKFPIDASGELANGTKFNGARDLKRVLKSNKNFVRSLARKMMTYGLGRGLEYPDKCALDAALAEADKHGNKFSALVTAIVTSDPFLKRQIEVVKN
ncbi:MAG: DUF1592 domain-containing protein [Chthoniobacteraceae bacterium]